MAGNDELAAIISKHKEMEASPKPATQGHVMKVATEVCRFALEKFVSKEDFMQALKLSSQTDEALHRDIRSVGKSSDSDVAKAMKIERELAKKDLGEALELMKELAAEARAEIKERDVRIAKLETRLAAVEAEPMTYQGTFEVGKYYSRGSVVTHRGGMWHCAEGTTTPPDFGAPQWTLCVKSGRDGKDLR